ncbi:MAG: type II toxin-antitoxin system HicA family toxin [Acetobacteraceae bacterium]
MADDFDRRLVEMLKEAGCYHVRDGRHPIWFSPTTKRHFPVPTGIKSRHTANEILKQAGLPKAF